MTFKVGETVVYPHHGAAKIEAIEQRTIKGEQKTYLVLKVAQGDLYSRFCGPHTPKSRPTGLAVTRPTARSWRPET